MAIERTRKEEKVKGGGQCQWGRNTEKEGGAPSGHAVLKLSVLREENLTEDLLLRPALNTWDHFVLRVNLQEYSLRDSGSDKLLTAVLFSTELEISKSGMRT